MPSTATIVAPSWPPLPSRPRLDDRVIDLIWVDLEAAPIEPERALSAAERARAARFHAPEARRRWAAARAALRGILARYVGVEPGALRLASGPHGKPLLEPAGRRSGPEPPRFNLSHSGPVALCAVSAAGEVGVDVEVRERRVDELAIAARAFGEAEAKRLAALDERRRETEFLRAWVRHEARLKCLGRGIGAGERVPDAALEGLWVEEWRLGPRAAAAVAAERQPRELRRWTWRSRPAESRPG